MTREVRRFAPSEDDYIRASAGVMPVTAVARALGRPPCSVVSREITLGIRVPNRTCRKFSTAEDESIRECAGRVSMYDVAKRLGRKPSSVYGRARALGLRFDPAMRSANRRLRAGYYWLPLVVDGKRVWRQEHRYVMEQRTGRPLTANEYVHHKDLNKTNNDIENLHLCTAQEHRAIHNRLERLAGSKGVVPRLLSLGIIAFDDALGRYVLVDAINERDAA